MHVLYAIVVHDEKILFLKPNFVDVFLRTFANVFQDLKWDGFTVSESQTVLKIVFLMKGRSVKRQNFI